MKERVQEIFRSIKEWWGNLSRKIRIILLSALGGILVVSLILVLVLNHTTYVLLYSGISNQESATVLATLGEMGIEPRMQGGAIFVPENDVSRIRVQLARNGVAVDTFNYDIYDEAGMTATQSERNQRLIHQTQNRLQETIETFEEIEQAVVNIGMPQKSIYAVQATNEVPTASVKVTKRLGAKMTPELVQAILNIVGPAVPGLTEDNITISDETGDVKGLLTDDFGSGSKLTLESQVSALMKGRLLALLQPVYGAENVVVEVNPVLDTDSKVTQKIEYFPIDEENPRDNPLDYALIEREKLGGLAGPVQGVVGANDNVDVPMYQAQEVDVSDADSFVARDEYDYLVSSVKQDIVSNGYALTDMSVAVVINTSTLPDAQRDSIIDSVAKASGVPAEKVSVQNIQFNGLPEYVVPEATPDTTRILVISLFFVLLAAIIITLIILHYRKKKAEQLAAEQAALEAQYAEDAVLLDLMGEEEGYEPIVIPETQEAKLRTQIRDLATSDPEIVAQLIKTWLLQ
ncbi:flagellar M-ring protein FliF [Ruminococcaceae bacterium OttesenSCG-928-L11]|nr:flagellar M-ring protein FliF [Ruminococcaceae bacterium OttesenSCG-928-L11]